MSVGLVLEGGGMRGSYTAGVLSAFEDNDVYFPSIYGISAGACNALSYISGQSYRNHDIFYEIFRQILCRCNRYTNRVACVFYKR